MSAQSNPPESTTPGSTHLNGAGSPPLLGDPTPTYQDLLQECQNLRAELSQVKEDRDAYLKALYAHLPHQEFTFTREELFSHLGKVPSWNELMEDLKRDPAYVQQS